MSDYQKDSFSTSAAFALYTAAFTGGLVAFAPYALLKMLNTPAYRAGLAQRLSLQVASPARPAASPAWIQAVSLGEVKSVAPLVSAIVKQTQCPVHLTTTTQTGFRMATELFSSPVDVAYFPLDLRLISGRLLARLRPRVIILFETEIWPNFIRTAVSKGIPVVIVNGRISETSFRYYRLVPPIFGSTFAKISRMGMQSEADAERAISLGADPERVHLCGNMKFDSVAQPPSQERVDSIRRMWRLPVGASLIVGGSTHEGEEQAILRSFSRILVEQPDTWLLLAPRHPERFNEVESLIRAQGFNALRRSRCAEVSRPPDPRTVLLLDTIGELAQIYALSTVSFVGGSLADIGGHNIIEPASAGKPVLFGPHMHHFQNIQDAFLSERAAIRVASEEDLCRQMCHLLKNPPEAEAVGKAAARVVKNNKGATARYFDLIKDFLRDG